MEEYEELLKPIKELVINGKINDSEAINLLLKELKKSAKKENSEKYQKFKRLSGLLFKNEPCLDIGYRMPNSGHPYKFLKASEHYVSTFYSVCKYLCDKEFNNEEGLLSLMKEVLSNKRILELGCGVGNSIKVLKQLGAKVSGIDIISELKGKIEDIDLIVGDCENLGKLSQGELFDIIYSKDFFTDTVLNRDKAKKISEGILKVLKKGGLVIHHITYQKVDIPVILLSVWLYCRKTGEEYNAAKEDYLKNNPVLYSNQPPLTKEDYESLGFEVLEYQEEDGEFAVILRK